MTEPGHVVDDRLAELSDDELASLYALWISLCLRNRTATPELVAVCTEVDIRMRLKETLPAMTQALERAGLPPGQLARLASEFVSQAKDSQEILDEGQRLRKELGLEGDDDATEG